MSTATRDDATPAGDGLPDPDRLAELALLERQYLAPRGPSVVPPRPVHRNDSRATPLFDGHDYFGDLQQELSRFTAPGEGEHPVVYVMGWTVDPDLTLPGSQEKLAAQLARLASTGVDVRVIVWANRFVHAASGLNQQEIPPQGVTVTRRYMLARDSTGEPALWVARRTRLTAAPPAPTLRFDVAVPR